jgi:hypothetical protein
MRQPEQAAGAHALHLLYFLEETVVFGIMGMPASLIEPSP